MINLILIVWLVVGGALALVHYLAREPVSHGEAVLLAAVVIVFWPVLVLTMWYLISS